MKVINIYIVSVDKKPQIGKYTTSLYECEYDRWYIMYESTFGPGTIFGGLNGLREIEKKEALKLIEEAKQEAEARIKSTKISV